MIPLASHVADRVRRLLCKGLFGTSTAPNTDDLVKLAELAAETLDMRRARVVELEKRVAELDLPGRIEDLERRLAYLERGDPS